MPRKRTPGNTAIIAPAQQMTKTDAIKEALKNLGAKSSLKDLAGYASQKFGLVVSPNYVSLIKGNLKKQARRDRLARKEAQRVEANGFAEPATPTSDFVEAVRLAKKLVQISGGTENAKELLDVLAE